jgi:hypothetical protein
MGHGSRLRIIAASTAGNVILTMLRPLTLAVDPPSMAPTRHAAFAWDGSSPSRAPAAVRLPALGAPALRLGAHRHPWAAATPADCR